MNNIRIINTGGDTAFERNKGKILRKIEFMVNSGSCNDAFKRAGLPTPLELVKSGRVTLSSTKALTNSSYNSTLGIPDSVRVEALEENAPAQTIRNDRTGNAVTFFGSDAFDGSYLDEAVPHEFIHVAGIGKRYGWFGWLGVGHDLSGYKNYANIIANCKDH
ncbi:MAG: hypothetical protein ACREBG_04765 [Pyrinomonadaceae bacterium]